MSKIRNVNRDKVAKFEIGFTYWEEVKENVITVEQNNTEYCFFDIGADTWKSCEDGQKEINDQI